MSSIRVIAFYLPQFHPIPENDAWWGPGFTEWTNVVRARPSFRGHVQPKIPRELGFYDLRLSESREAQAKLAENYGIHGFCYWHYWFGNGRRILERPFEEVLSSGKPDFPFCLGWANHSWTTRTWTSHQTTREDSLLIEQSYLDDQDHVDHFNCVLSAFKDNRYITVDDKPLFLIHDPFSFPGLERFVELWRGLARDHGLKGIHFVGTIESVGRFDHGFFHNYLEDPPKNFLRARSLGLDAVNSNGMRLGEMRAVGQLRRKIERVFQHLIPNIRQEKYSYSKVSHFMYCAEDEWEWVYPTVIPRWDRTPRRGRGSDVYVGSTPELFESSLRHCLSLINERDIEHRIVFLRAWNEWGEGNYIEPDLEWGLAYLEALKRTLGS